ncbi:MAG: cation diffusion facilitator family transporter, partial [Gammaproteobacteria bacterium]|nr:cation diffusion facilitator family transporter [Gammaproteobacteria bacterium]
MTVANPYRNDPSGALQQTGLRRLATYASLGTALTLIVIKLIAFLLTDSVSLLASLIDSTIDAFSSLIIMVGVYHATQPPDKEHRYGHGKYEAIASLTQAMFIAGSGVFLVYESLQRFVHPQSVHHPMIGIGVMVASIVLTLALVIFQHYVIRKTDSVAIASDSIHYKGDLLMNLAVIVALASGSYTSWPYVDPIIALAIAGFLLYGAWGIGKQSIDILVDRELPDEDRQKITEIVLEHDRVRDIHDLRTRNSG